MVPLLALTVASNTDSSLGSGMTYYYCTRRFTDAFGVFLDCFPNQFRDSLKMLPYERLFRIEIFPPGTFIFTDLDRLADPVMAKVTAFSNALSTDEPRERRWRHTETLLNVQQHPWGADKT